MGFYCFCGSRENESFNQGCSTSSKPAKRMHRILLLTQGDPNATRLWRFDISAGRRNTVATYPKPGLVAFSFHLIWPGLDHEARARTAGFSGTHPQLCGIRFCLISGYHKLLVRGDQEGGETILHRTAAEGEAVVLHPFQQLEHQRQPAGAVHLWDRRGEVSTEEVPHGHIFLVWAGRWHER